uniref:Uncharacterized protein n=1 Tax=Nothobranchius furzeri TaxID=105023 RepID=A0A8C6MJX0_NOTFU
MAAPLEVIVSSDSASQLWNCTVFDLHSGSSLLSYRGGNSSARSLSVLRGDFLLSAQLSKNFINVWEIQRKVGTHPDTSRPFGLCQSSGPNPVCVENMTVNADIDCCTLTFVFA